MIDLKLNKRILLVELDEKFRDSKMILTYIQNEPDLVAEKNGYLTYIKTLPMANWSQPIKASEVTEEIAKEIVEEDIRNVNGVVRHKWTDYGRWKGSSNWTHRPTALTSFQSLLAHHSLSPDKTILIIEK